jgi:hypothetical protein
MGADEGGVDAASAGECCNLCNAAATCKFFSFMTDKQHCLFKSSDSGRQPNKDRISGSAGGGPPAPTPVPAIPTPAPVPVPKGKPDFYFSCTAGLNGGARLATPMCDSTLPLAARLDDLLERMTDKEKCASLDTSNPSVPRLGLPNMRSGESTHGLNSGCGESTGSSSNASGWSTGCPTSFPAGVALGAAFDTGLYASIGGVIGLEARGLSNQNGKSGLYFLDPNMWVYVPCTLRAAS